LTSSLEKWYKIGDVCNVTDFVANGSFESLRNNVEYLQQKDYAILIRLRDFNNKWKPPYVYVSKESYDFLSKSNLEPGDVIVSNIGEPGVVFRAPDLDSKMTLGPNSLVCKVEPSNELLCKDFFYYYLNSHYCQWEIRSRIGGSAQPKFNKTEFRNIKIRLPSKSQQVSSVRLLLNFDKMINNNMKTIEIISRTINSLFRSWFIDFDPVKAKLEGRIPYGMGEETAALFPDSFENSELGPIPSGWSIGTIHDIAKQRKDIAKPDDFNEMLPYIGLEHMPRNSIALTEWGVSEGLESNKFRYSKKDILFGKLRPYFHKVGPAPLEGVCSTDILVIQPIGEKSGGFLLPILSSEHFVNFVSGISEGVGLPRTKWEHFKLYKIALPPVEIREKFDLLVNPMLQIIQSSIHESKALEHARDALLPRLMSGELKVN